MLNKAVFALLALLVVTTSAKKEICKCGDVEYAYTLPLAFDNDDVRSLRIPDLNLPGGNNGGFGKIFGQSMRGLVVVSIQILQQMRDQNIDQKYIVQMQKYKQELGDRINTIGAITDGRSYQQKMIEFENYLTELLVRISKDTETIKDRNIQNFFYSYMLQILSIRSLLVSSLDSLQCIFSTGGANSPNGPGGQQGPGGSSSSGENHGSHEHGGKHHGSHEHGGGSSHEKGGGKGGKDSHEKGGGKGGKDSHEKEGGKGGKDSHEKGGGKGGKDSHEKGGGKRGKNSHEKGGNSREDESFWQSWVS